MQNLDIQSKKIDVNHDAILRLTQFTMEEFDSVKMQLMSVAKPTSSPPDSTVTSPDADGQVTPHMGNQQRAASGGPPSPPPSPPIRDDGDDERLSKITKLAAENPNYIGLNTFDVDAEYFISLAGDDKTALLKCLDVRIETADTVETVVGCYACQSED